MGKASKLRPCPALGGKNITSAECGENRISVHRCPADCRFNPFAERNYDELLSLESDVDRACIARLGKDDADAPGFVEQAIRANRDHGGHAAVAWRLHFRRTAGTTVAERWAAENFPGLRNDGRVLMRYKMEARVVLLEITRVVDRQKFFAVDLLSPGSAPMEFVDRSLSAGATRFATLLTWSYPLPHFRRVVGTGIKLQPMGDCDALEVVIETVRHLGGPVEPGPAREAWLAENFCRLNDSIAATSAERGRLMMAGIDAQFGVATYETIAGDDECWRRLLGVPDVDEDDVSDAEIGQGVTRAAVWFRKGESDVGAGRPVLGRVVVGPKGWRVEAIGEKCHAALRAAFEEAMGDTVRFVAERRDDLGKRLSLGQPSGDLRLVPSRLLENIEALAMESSRLPARSAGSKIEDYKADFRVEALRALPDQPLPALGGRTPREAAADPALRPAVIRLFKRHVSDVDEANLQSGRRDDINPILRDLGLHEIDFPPPPQRVPAVPFGGPIEANIGGADAMPASNAAPVFARPPAPRLEGPPFSMPEAAERLETALRGFDTAADGMDELARSGSAAIDELYQLSADLIDEEGFHIFVTFVLQGWFSMVPVGVRAPSIDFDAVAKKAFELFDSVTRPDSVAENVLNAISDGARQPGLTLAIFAMMARSAGTLPRKKRPGDESVLGMMVVMRAFLDELDRALRQ